ncbi:alpha-ketoglutarate-dependent dioxygenase AlkB family protein [Dictyobacter kobayashii]|uniref:DNA methylase n=1 Tax=Dictyobacter kobayashii TaxID=2014872 RepID=A0A402ASR1_9CHLR|nr:alpha-ketoglutarate-dependent dioxygenase AlkB [Dictyobacter kobayashii]GCE22129.1 DNA methylase [Dictyobacter kobayashii]
MIITLDQNARMDYRRNWLSGEKIEALLAEIEQLPRQQERIQLYGKWYEQPRLTAWEGMSWTAESGYREQVPAPDWTPMFVALRDQLGTEFEIPFNAVLINEYRGGADSIGWHADNDPLIDQRVIASLSIGGERVFKIRSKRDHSKIYQVPLGNGDLLIMHNAQTHWEHSIAKTKKNVATRFNLTFRHYPGK